MHPGPQVHLLRESYVVTSLGHPTGVTVQLHCDDVAGQVPPTALLAVRIPAVSQGQTLAFRLTPQKLARRRCDSVAEVTSCCFG